MALIAPDRPKSNWYPLLLKLKLKPAPVPKTSPIKSSAIQEGISFILDKEQLDLMGFLKFVAKRRLDIDPENMDFTDED